MVTSNNIQYGISTLSDIIDQGSMYVDKTARIYDLISQPTKRFFLSRPRRFGKSLLIDTLSQIFSGNKELFKDLAIYKKNYDWKKYVVLRIDMAKVDMENPYELKASLCDFIKRMGRNIGVDVSSLTDMVTPKSYLSALLEHIEYLKQKAVILVDECDYPIISNIHKTQEEISGFLTVLRDFYLSLKSNDSAVHFIFLTVVYLIIRLILISILFIICYYKKTNSIKLAKIYKIIIN